MSDILYDTDGHYCGPKYWTTDVYVGYDNNYVTSSMKRDESMYETSVFLGPAGDPDPVTPVTGPVRPVCPTSR